MNYQQFSMMNASFNRADQMAGYGMNAVGAGMNIGTAALGAVPMGIATTAAFSAGVGAWGAGAGLAGVAGAAGAAALPWAAAALPIMAGAAGVGFVGSQMMEGASQQQNLNATLSRSFVFNNQFGRRGFTRSDTSQIGAAMREMSHDVGPGGELTSMRELTDLAGKMGQMGMGRGVRDAQEFNQKFREMIKTVKTIATEMNTSMTQAMEFMQASKSAGIFNKADQIRFAQQVQGIATNSGLATSEVTAMANVGAQISRAYGGLGRQGAMGGIRAIGQVGGAMQAGVLSEEDIYNATGQTGAEGRAALATNMMSQTGSFLKSGKGRWFMASLAGANGTIDEASAQRYMMGDLGTGGTRQMAGRNLGEVGRANFIRNEGRLRGAVMERFGALAPSMALMGWASQRGIDINNMDDRSMLFAQRHLGMGRDELDAAVKMAQDMPRIMQSQMQQESFSKYGKQLSMDQKNRGLEGAKRRIEHAKEKLLSGLQQAGADMYTDLTNTVEKWLDNWAGTAIPAATEGIQNIWSETVNRGGGAAATARFEAVFGGGKTGARRQEMLSRLGGGVNAPAGLQGGRMTWDEFSGQNKMANQFMGAGAVLSLTGIGSVIGTPMMLAGLGMKAGGWLGGAGETMARMEKAGFKGRIAEIGQMKGTEQQAALNEMLDRANSMQKALTGSIRNVDVQGELRSELLREYAQGDYGKAGMDTRGAELERVLKARADKGDKQASELLTQYRETKNPAEKVKMVAGIEKSLGIEGGTNSMTAIAERLGSLDSATAERMRGMSQTERDRYAGSMMLGVEERGSVWSAIGKGAAVGAGVGALFLGIGAIPSAIGGAAIGAAKYYLGSGAKDTRLAEASAKYARSEEGMRLLGDVLNRSTAGIDQANKLIGDAQNAAASQDDKAKAAVARNALMANEIDDAVNAAGGLDKLSDAEKERLLKSNRDKGGKAEDFKTMREGVVAAQMDAQEQQKTNRERITKYLKEMAKTEGGRMEGMGIAKYDAKTDRYALTADTMAELKKNGGNSMAAAALQMEILNAQDPDQVEAIMQKSQQKYDLLSKMSVEELSKHVKTSSDASGAVMLSDAKRFKSLMRSKGGGGGAIAAFMGLGGGETRSEKLALQSAYGQGEEQFIKEYMRQTGLTGEAATQMRAALAGPEGIYAKTKSGKGSEVEIAAVLDKLKSDPKMKDAFEKREDAKKSPSERSLYNIEQSLATMSKGLTADAISGAMAKSMGEVGDKIAAAIKEL